MLTKINKLLIVGALCLVPTMGCKGTQHHGSSWGNEMASNVTYDAPQPTSSHTPPAAHDEWICSMHPTFRQTEPGVCSICGMDLVRSGGPSSANDPASESGDSHSSDADHSGHSGSSGCGGGGCGG